MHVKRFSFIMKEENPLWTQSDIKKLSLHAFKILTNAETQWPYSVEENHEKTNYMIDFLYRIEAEENVLFKKYEVKEELNIAINHLHRCLLEIENQFHLNQNQDGEPIVFRDADPQYNVDKSYITRKLKKLSCFENITTNWRRKAVIHVKNMIDYLVNRDD